MMEEKTDRLMDELDTYLREQGNVNGISLTNYYVIRFLLKQVVRLEKKIESLEYQKAPAEPSLGGPMSGSFRP